MTQEPKIFFDSLVIQALGRLLEATDAEATRIQHEIHHAISVVCWLFRYAENPSRSLQLAGALHDCERLFQNQQIQKENFTDYNLYKQKHSQNSAALAIKILTGLQVKPALIKDVTQLITLHEFGGTPQSDILKDCDSLSFFDSNIFFYLRKNSQEALLKKIQFMYNRMSPRAQTILNSSGLDFKLSPEIFLIFQKATLPDDR